MEIRILEIEAILNELKDDSQLMAKVEVRATVEQLDEILTELQLKQTLGPPDETIQAEVSLEAMDGLAVLIPQMI